MSAHIHVLCNKQAEKNVIDIIFLLKVHLYRVKYYDHNQIFKGQEKKNYKNI